MTSWLLSCWIYNRKHRHFCVSYNKFSMTRVKTQSVVMGAAGVDGYVHDSIQLNDFFSVLDTQEYIWHFSTTIQSLIAIDIFRVHIAGVGSVHNELTSQHVHSCCGGHMLHVAWQPLLGLLFWHKSTQFFHLKHCETIQISFQLIPAKSDLRAYFSNTLYDQIFPWKTQWNKFPV